MSMQSTRLRPARPLPPPPPRPPMLIKSLLDPNGEPLVVEGDSWISDGLAGVILRRGDTALKIPRIQNTSGSLDYDLLFKEHSNTYNLRCRDTEVQAYLRIRGLPGIVKFLGASSSGIELAYMPNGSLEKYMESCKDRSLLIPPSLKIQWIWAIINAVCGLHERRIVMLDLALRNVLVDKDLSVKLCDFGNVLLLPAGANLSRAQRNGFMSVQQDIFDIGWVLYSIGVGRACHSRLERKDQRYDPELSTVIDEYEEDTLNGIEDIVLPEGAEGELGSMLWPLLWPHDFPDTTNMICGSVIQRCWKEIGYQNVDQIRDDMYSELQADINRL